MFRKKLEYTDKEIIELIRKGDSNNVLFFLYKTVQPKTTAWILKNNGDKDEAQDIFQDAIVSFYKYVIEDKFNPENSVAGFIFGIVKNKWVNRVKEKNKTVSIAPYEFQNSNNAEKDDKDKLQKIEGILSQLGETCKQLLTYRIFYKMGMDDIAFKMGFSNADTVKTKNYKCKQRLIKLIRDEKNLKRILYNEQ